MTEQEYHQDPLTAEEFRLWKDSRTTRKIYHLLSRHQESYKRSLISGCLLNLASSDATAMATARTVGIVEGMDKFLDMEVADHD